MLDYAIEVEAYDAQVGSLLEVLEDSGEAENTLVVVTSDHGMPFPRVKGHNYDNAHHMPLVVRGRRASRSPGGAWRSFVSFIDLAPTILEIFGVDGGRAGMSPITGHSFIDLLQNRPRDRRW